jgi:PTH1 family peptidyl-tRNA hydrolase
VLHRPRKEEQPLIEESIDKSLRIIPLVVEGKFDVAMMELHTA